MGYHVRPGLVTEWEQTLEHVKAAVENGEQAVFESEHPGRESYGLRRALKATETYRTECNGRFAGLGEIVSISTDRNKIICSPKGGQLKISAVRFNEHDVLEYIKGYSGNLDGKLFWPTSSFNLEEFTRTVDSMGFQIERFDTDPGFGDEGQYNVIFSRKEQKKKSDFDLIGGE